jgi:glycosyltransferase involved in cell wall biosynthesis
MSESEPLVTVGMATYNGGEYLTESLSSALENTYSNIELLIVDDGSTDDSVAIARKIGDRRIRIITNESNSGLVMARQKIMHEARGTYLAWLDQDDIAYSNRIATQVSFLTRNEKVGACGSLTFHRVHELSGKEWLLKSRHIPKGHEEIRAQMPFLNPLSFNTATMRMSAFRQNNLNFREEYGNTLDYDMWSRAADVMELANIQDYLGEYRVHSRQTSRGPALDRMLQAAWSVQTDVLGRNLGVLIDADSDHIHRRMTLAPRLLVSECDAVEVGAWLSLLAEKNREISVYQERAFEKALRRQWVLCLLHVSRGIGFAKASKLAGASHLIAGIRNRDLSHSALSFLLNEGLEVAQKMIRGDGNPLRIQR